MSNPSRRAPAVALLVALAALALPSPGCVFAPGAHGHCDEDCTHFAKSGSKPKAHCPVTGDAVSKDTSPSATVDGDTYYFHCNTCKQRFLAEPGAYLHGGAKGGDDHSAR